MKTQRTIIGGGDTSYEMDDYQRVEIIRMFPWLEKHVSLGASQMYLSVLGPEIFDYQLAGEREFNHSPFNLGFSGPYHEEMYFLDDKGVMVTNKSSLDIRTKKWFFFGPVVTRKIPLNCKGKADSCRNVFQTLYSLDADLDRVRFVVSYFQYTSAVIIYKVPESLNLKQLLKHRCERPVIANLEEFQKA